MNESLGTLDGPQARDTEQRCGHGRGEQQEQQTRTPIRGRGRESQGGGLRRVDRRPGRAVGRRGRIRRVAVHATLRGGDAFVGGIGVPDDGVEDGTGIELDDDLVDGPVELVAGDPHAVVLAPAGPVDHGAVVLHDDAGPGRATLQRALADPNIVTDGVDEGDRGGGLEEALREDLVVEVGGCVVLDETRDYALS